MTNYTKRIHINFVTTMNMNVMVMFQEPHTMKLEHSEKTDKRTQHNDKLNQRK